MRIATIDIGTNSAKMLIAEVNPQTREIKPIREEISLCRLGEGSQKDKILKPHAIDRTLEGLKKFKKMGDDYGVQNFLVAATMCTRRAENKQEFLERVENETQWPVWVMTGEEEAQTSYKGARSLFFDLEGPVGAIDIGGGSSEWIYDPADNSDPRVFSMELGSVHETEQFFASQPPSLEAILKLRNYIEARLKQLTQNLFPAEEAHFLGIGGTVVNISLMIQPSGKLDPIRYSDLSNLVNKLSEMTTDERIASYPKLEKGRADVILAGAMILQSSMNFFNKQKCLVSYRGLRYGLIPSAF